MPAERQNRDTPLTESERIHHVLSRFTFGPTPDLVAEIRQTGLDEWFESQLRGVSSEPEHLRKRLSELKSLKLTNQEILQSYRGNRSRKRRAPPAELKDAVLLRSIYGANQVLEVSSDFFRNHLNVDLNKDNVRYFATEYERRVIRGNSLGSFGNMLLASAKHPAMLVYLDNALSRKPPSDQELRELERNTRRATGSKDRAREQVEIARQRGLNENYARELLELHTLGVDNYYTQRDIIEVARALTGWTVQTNDEDPVTFLFRPDMHVEGNKRVLRGTIAQDRDDPVTEGERVIQRLLKHPGTAQFVCWKLCRYLIDDDPPKDAVKRVAEVFKKTRGDLPSVYRAIYQDREFFSPRYFLSKFKRPLEFVTSAVRVTQAEISYTAALQEALKQLSEPIYECEDPTGYYDQAEAWNDPGVMVLRWRFAMRLVLGKLKGVKIPSSFYDGLHLPIPHVWKKQLAERILNTRMSPRTSDVIDDMVRRYLEQEPDAGPEQLAPLVLGMLLGSPEFQRQ